VTDAVHVLRWVPRASRALWGEAAIAVMPAMTVSDG
jgi:hypothetical protein